MKRLNLDKIKKYESPPKIVNIFSENEIKMMQRLYFDLPERKFNQKQGFFKNVLITTEPFITLINRGAIVSKHVVIVNEKSF